MSDKFIEMVKNIRNNKVGERMLFVSSFGNNTIIEQHGSYIQKIVFGNKISKIIQYEKSNGDIIFETFTGDNLAILNPYGYIIYSDFFRELEAKYRENETLKEIKEVTEKELTLLQINKSCLSCGANDYEKINNNEYICKYCQRRVYFNE